MPSPRKRNQMNAFPALSKGMNVGCTVRSKYERTAETMQSSFTVTERMLQDDVCITIGQSMH